MNPVQSPEIRRNQSGCQGGWAADRSLTELFLPCVMEAVELVSSALEYLAAAVPYSQGRKVTLHEQTLGKSGQGE